MSIWLDMCDIYGKYDRAASDQTDRPSDLVEILPGNEMADLGIVTHVFKAGQGENQREYELVGIGPIRFLLDAITFATDEAEHMRCTLDEVDVEILTTCKDLPDGFGNITHVQTTGGGIPDAHAVIAGGSGDRCLVRRTTVH